MIPQQFKQMFGLNSQKDINMANNIWKMLDQMSENSPQKYKQFIEKNIKQGVQDVKEKKEEKQKPFRLKPEKGFLLQFDMNLNQKYISGEQKDQKKISQKLTQKLDINRQKWQTVKNKFDKKIHVVLNVCFTDRVKLPLDKSKKQIQNIRIDQIKDIEIFYYSLQGPFQTGNKETKLNQYQYCIIVNKNTYNSLMNQSYHGKKMLMSLSISYFQQRLQNDKNILLKIYDPQKYNKLAFYSVEKQSIQINSLKNYFYKNSDQMAQFLLERDVDKMRQNQIKQQEQKVLKKIKQTQQKKDIKLRQTNQNEQNVNKKLQDLSNVTGKSSQNKKKPLIQVLNETQNNDQLQQELPYQLKQSQQGYHIEILTSGITSIEILDLQISDKQIRLKLQKNEKVTTIDLKQKIDAEKVKAKLKKKINRLIIEAPFLVNKKV